ncbi:FAD-dependent oxidoreductase [Nocardioides sp. AX2bis]|uniref:FAD-dependent oxidoreductase n=1 Tax=Nocardioides sp. AX2bis TaxID=2653157 RepID=UPI0012F036A9|nr:FAD-dependent oxidoreductase [Nocardioides sp. AX2bis]VXB35086.1 putative ferredoxin/ferredoxin--NADP reductase [Nocardioides sp. AX2bis]
MPYVVTQSCCADASCVVACPVNCLHPAPGEPGFAEAEMLYVDPDSCVDCGACATACPVDAVVPHTALTPDQEPFRQLNADYFAVFPHRDRTPLAVVPRQRRLRASGPFAVAVVGAGPAGLQVADELLRHPEVTVDVLDRLPTPYGLVRSGVAPDHQATKQVERLFAMIEDQPGFGYLLGVEVGRDVRLAELAGAYDAVVYAVGASADRRLDVPGEDLAGSVAATDLVGWYNGHPDRRALAVDLSHERAVVVGNGNVALDVARVLTLDPAVLAGTDVSTEALAVLRTGGVREVVVLGRRGPAQAAFTVPELVGLRGLAEAGRLEVVVDTGGEALGTTPRERVLAEIAALPRPAAGTPRVVLRFLTRPVEVLGDAAGERVTGLRVERTRLVEVDGRVTAVATGLTEDLATGLVVRSVGYRGHPVTDLPYDDVTGTVPHERGRVRTGVYVAGWVKRGPTGFIGTNKTDAQETVEVLLDDLDVGHRADAVDGPAARARRTDLRRRLRRESGALDLAAWRRLDAEERRRGEVLGRPRVKVLDPGEAAAIARGGRDRSLRDYAVRTPGAVVARGRRAARRG